MRWLLGMIAAALIFVLIYLGSAAASLARLAAAVRAGDGAAVLERTDVNALRRSLTDQIVRAYLERTGSTRKVSPMEKLLANTYGATIADAIGGQGADRRQADANAEIRQSGCARGIELPKAILRDLAASLPVKKLSSPPRGAKRSTATWNYDALAGPARDASGSSSARRSRDLRLPKSTAIPSMAIDTNTNAELAIPNGP